MADGLGKCVWELRELQGLLMWHVQSLFPGSHGLSLAWAYHLPVLPTLHLSSTMRRGAQTAVSPRRLCRRGQQA